MKYFTCSLLFFALMLFGASGLSSPAHAQGTVDFGGNTGPDPNGTGCTDCGEFPTWPTTPLPPCTNCDNILKNGRAFCFAEVRDAMYETEVAAEVAFQICMAQVYWEYQKCFWSGCALAKLEAPHKETPWRKPELVAIDA